jgi:DNA-binding transcriptional ArsR family regulator
MSYDTEHVRNAGDNPGMITSIPTFTELLANSALASLYTSIRRSAGTTAPELTETAAVSKKTVYEYLRKLEQAGLITESGEQNGTTVYEAADFELTLTVRDVEVSVTPELVEGIAHADEYPVIDRVLDNHGLVTFALAHDLVKAHSNGDVTIRQIPALTGLSPGTAYDIVEALYTIHDLGSEDSSPATFTPDDVAADDSEMRERLLDE